MRHNNQNHNEREKMFNDLYNIYTDPVFRFCLIKVSDREIALDLTQEVFTRFWEHISQKNIHVEYPKTFLFTIARNAVIDWYRKKKSISIESLANPETGDPYEPFSDDMMIDIGVAQEGRFLLDKIHELDSGYRDVVYLRFVQGLSPVEISKIVGMSVNATSVRITRGLEKLRTLTGYNIGIDDTADQKNSNKSATKHPE